MRIIKILLTLLMTLNCSYAIVGEKNINRNAGEVLNPFLVFGFKKGGFLRGKIKYIKDDAPIELFV